MTSDHERKDAAAGPTARDAALALYRRRASVYDWELALFEPLRLIAVERLALHGGDTVLDVGCGTGLSLALLQRAVGAGGHIVGIEQSPEMLALARERLSRVPAGAVELVAGPMECAEFVVMADAALLHFTHDILRCPEAIANVMRHLKPGARVVATGLKWAPPGWLWAVNLMVLPAALHSVTTFDGMDAPWTLLQEQLDDFAVEEALMGGGFVASGRRKA